MKTALGFFQSVAESNPNFVFTTGSSPRQSIWSYVGRTQYLTDQFPQARQSLERALSGDREENIARLYLGLTLIQLGGPAARLTEIESGLRGIQSFIDNITQAQRFSIGRFWDPNKDIRSAIQYSLEMISKEGLNWEQLIASTERIAMQMEREGDLARRQESGKRDLGIDSGLRQVVPTGRSGAFHLPGQQVSEKLPFPFDWSQMQNKFARPLLRAERDKGEGKPVPRTYVRGFGALPSGCSKHSSPHLRTERSVVRGKTDAALPTTQPLSVRTKAMCTSWLLRAARSRSAFRSCSLLRCA
jgi:hypothetical protein